MRQIPQFKSASGRKLILILQKLIHTFHHKKELLGVLAALRTARNTW
jgi:hypothetical protein